MHLLVTGAAGLIGSVTCRLLLDEGHTVVGVDNMNDYYDVALKRHRIESLIDRSGFTFIEADIESMPFVESLFAEHAFEAVVNLAARAGVRYSMENPFIYFTTNVTGTLNLLEAMRRTGVKKFVAASTSSLYAGQTMPFVETLPVNTPISPYAASKKAAEVLAYTYHYQYDIDVTVLRYFTVYGPAGRPDMSVFRFIKWINEGTPLTVYGDGTQGRDFTHVDDIAAGTVKAAMTDTGFEIINLGGGRNPISVNRLIELIESELGKSAVIDRKPFHSADMDATWADISKAKALLDWQPTISLEEGVKRTIAWHAEHDTLVRSIRT